MKRILLIILALGTITIQAQTPEAKLIKEFDAYVEKSRKQYQVPGLAITVVKDGKVLLKKGYGVRQLDKPEARERPNAVCVRLHY
jgi:CubicO group peptidase (beta-lactamase class C family)